jgi:hypothetical protein
MELNMRAGNLIDGITTKLVTPKLITNFQQLVMLLNTISFAFIISHPVFYILAMSEARKSLTSTAHSQVKQPMKVKLPINLHLTYAVTIFSNMLLVVLAWYAGSKLLLLAALITMGSLITEMFLFSKRNVIGRKADEIFIPENCGRYEKNYDNNSLFYCYNRQLLEIFGMFLFLTGTALWW